MKNLNEYIKESLLDDFGDIEKDVEVGSVKKFIEKNYYTYDSKVNVYKKDGSIVVDVDGDIEISWGPKQLTNGTFKFGKVNGDFMLFNNSALRSLEGAPEEVTGIFDCSDCKFLTSLEGAPKIVGGDFKCNGCIKLTSLKGAPKEVGRYFLCISCDSLKTLEGAPEKINGDFNCSNCIELQTLKGSPKSIGGTLNLANCSKLTSLKHCPQEIGDSLSLLNCVSLESFDGISKRICGKLLYNRVDGSSKMSKSTFAYIKKNIQKICKAKVYTIY